jgi:hypothetical protein
VNSATRAGPVQRQTANCGGGGSRVAPTVAVASAATQYRVRAQVC